MTNSDDLEDQLRQNLKLRRELVAEVAKTRDSSAKQRGSVSAAKIAEDESTEVSLEEQSDAKRREASRAGLVAGLLLLVLIGVAMFAGAILFVALR